MGIYAASAIAMYVYAVHLEKQSQRDGEQSEMPPPVHRVEPQDMKTGSQIFGLGTASMIIPMAIIKYKTFQRFQKALRALK